MKRALTLIAAVMATQAQALSCLPPSVATDFHTANDAEELYVVMLGTAIFDASLLPGENLAGPRKRRTSLFLHGLKAKR